MSAVPVLTKRNIDLKVMAQKAMQQLLNTAGGLWEKYSTNGIMPASDLAVVIAKPSDTDVYDRPGIAGLFDREALGKAYTDSLVNGEAAGVTMNSKIQSDMLSSMQQGMILRYTTRIRSNCAVLSRRKSIAASDIDITSAVELV